MHHNCPFPVWKTGEIKVAEEVSEFAADVIKIIDSVYDSRVMLPENARSSNVELAVDEDKLSHEAGLLLFLQFQTEVPSQSCHSFHLQ